MMRTYPGSLITFRCWRVNRYGVLHSTAISGQWHVGKNEAVCAKRMVSDHTPPAANCECGFYGMYQPRLSIFQPLLLIVFFRSVLGVIRCWGDVQLHASGARSQYAQVIALWLPWYTLPTRRSQIHKAAKLYNVPLFHSRKKMVEYANQQGSLDKPADAPDISLSERIDNVKLSTDIFIMPALVALAFSLLLLSFLQSSITITVAALSVIAVAFCVKIVSVLYVKTLQSRRA